MDLALSRPDAAPRRLAWTWRLPRGWLGPVLLAPSLLFLVAFTYWPLLQVGVQSFTVVRGREAVRGSLGNYAAVAADPAFRTALANNVVYAVGTVGPSLVLALGFALALSRSTRVNSALRALFFLPALIPLVAASSLFLFIFLPGVGLLDHHLAALGIAGANWLGDPDWALPSLMALTIWKNSGYYMLFFLAGLQSIPEESHEAARLDGAGPWQRLRYVTLPYLRPTLAFVGVIALINVVTQVDHVFVLTKGGPSDSTNLLLFYIYQQAVERYDPGKAAAATVVTTALLLAISSLSLRRFERGGDVER